MAFSNNLSVIVRISTGDIYAYANYAAYPTSSAYWLTVSDGSVYRINKGSFENSAVQFRRDEVTNSFVEGKFLVNALRENVTENLSIYAFANTVSALKANIDAVTSAVTNLHFYVEVTIENSKRVWTCQASDYTVAITNEFLHNRQALINVNLIRLPSETVYTV